MEGRMQQFAQKFEPVPLTEADIVYAEDIERQIAERKQARIDARAERKADPTSDEATKHRLKQAGTVMVAGLAAMGAAGVNQVRAEQLTAVEARPVGFEVTSSNDIHENRKVVEPSDVAVDQAIESGSPPGELETNVENIEPASWWPIGVRQHWLMIQEVAERHNVDPYIIATIMAEESTGQNVDNPSGATGLMQIMPSTAQDVARRRHMTYYNMHDEYQNIDFGAWLIADVVQRITESGVDPKSDVGLAMLAVGYGDGIGALQLWQRNGMQPELLSEQARRVIPLWTAMYHDRNQPSSPTYERERGGV